ncbi:MAG: phosphoribosylamine--glycine ligase [Oscillospiraceae bacterium]
MSLEYNKEYYRVLVVGGGGREHAIIKKLAQNKHIAKIFAAPGNGGIRADAVCVDIKANDIEKMVKFALIEKIDFCVVAPDDPLVLGMVDAMNAAGIAAFGPDKRAAILEGSKVFSKELMQKYDIPTAKYKAFSDAQTAIEYVKTENKFPTVIKADGLALGKGVIIAENFEEAQDGINSIMQDKVFGESGNEIVIEEFLEGPEVSVLSFCDGKTIIPMISAMDHKRANDGDNGLNTGGMGTIAPNPFFTKEILQECQKTIFEPTMNAMNKENRKFKGVIFFGLMITKSGTKVIEYNCRFGDPETQVVLPLLNGDLFEIFLAVTQEKLSEVSFSFEEKSCACVMIASGGYPQKYETGKAINGLDKIGQHKSAVIYHSGTKYENHEFKTAGGRVLGVSVKADNLETALKNAYEVVDEINFDGKHFRTDIGKKAL